MVNKFDLLIKLMNLSGPSGNEQGIRAIIQREIKPYVSDVHVDKFGNLVARKKGAKPTVVLAAHMDEIGIMIRKIDELGWIYCTELGGIDPVTLLGERVQIESKKGIIRGVITTENIIESGYQEAIPKMSDLIVDTGFTKKELESKGVEIGDILHLIVQTNSLGNEKYLVGKAMDNRVGCYMLVELAKRLKKSKNEIYFVFTVQEEIGLHGAKTSIFEINPEWSIVVDVTNTDDFTKKYTKCVGAGPCITIKDVEMLGNRCINQWFKDIAKKNKIPLQYDISEFGTTDALNISVSKGGIPTSVVCIPVRNIHTTSSVVHVDDVTNGIKLIELLMRNPPKKCIT